MSYDTVVQKRECDVCGTPFSPKTINQKRCCAECRDKHAESLRQSLRQWHPTEVNCVVCGSQFTTKQSRHEICSDECRRKKQRMSVTRKIYDHVCIVCSSHFTSNQRSHKMCSDECREKHYENLREVARLVCKSKLVSFVCLVCGKPETTNNPKQKFCSADCRKQFKPEITCSRCLGKFKGNYQTKYCPGCRSMVVGNRSQKLPTVISEIKVKTMEYNERKIKYWHINGFTNTLRESVMERDGYECYICRKKTQLHVHHIIPRKDGGKHEPENLVTLCSGCHRSIEHGDMENAIIKCTARAIREVYEICDSQYGEVT